MAIDKQFPRRAAARCAREDARPIDFRADHHPALPFASP
jgi:hypothetical protein